MRWLLAIMMMVAGVAMGVEEVTPSGQVATGSNAGRPRLMATGDTLVVPGAVTATSVAVAGTNVSTGLSAGYVNLTASASDSNVSSPILKFSSYNFGALGTYEALFGLGPTGVVTMSNGAGTAGTVTTFSAPILKATTTLLGTGTVDVTAAPLAGGSPVVLEGATDNAFETTIAVTDPTADRTITIKDASGSVVLNTSGNLAEPGTIGATTPGDIYSTRVQMSDDAIVYFLGTGVNALGLHANPTTASRDILLPDASGTVALTTDIVAEADTLATVTGRGASTSTAISVTGTTSGTGITTSATTGKGISGTVTSTGTGVYGEASGGGYAVRGFVNTANAGYALYGSSLGTNSAAVISRATGDAVPSLDVNGTGCPGIKSTTDDATDSAIDLYNASNGYMLRAYDSGGSTVQASISANGGTNASTFYIKSGVMVGKGSTGDGLLFGYDGTAGTLKPAALGSARTWTLPDASGSVVLNTSGNLATPGAIGGGTPAAITGTTITGTSVVNSTTQWRDWAAAGIFGAFATDLSVPMGWEFSGDNTGTFISTNATGNIAVASIPFGAGTTLKRLRIKWQGTTGTDGIKFTLVKRDDSSTATSFTTIGAQQSPATSASVTVTTYDFADEVMVEGYSYSILLEAVVVGSSVKAFSLGVETSNRNL